VLELPGGDIQVREDGDPRDPPLLLIHGYGASLRWWDRVVPALSRGHRVIRLDLLGHGGSEKPRSGYSMEHQADLVAGAARRLGIRRTPVVGHSMGGIVATALVERHRELVSRVMTIGTPPDDQGEEPPIYLRPVFWPVTGEAIRTLAPDSAVRAEVERTSPPRFDIPKRLARDISDRTTYTSMRETGEALDDYWDERALDERLADERIPLTVVYGPAVEGEEDAALDFRSVPGVRFVRLDGLGHSPQVERPARAAPVILDFARGTRE
jgi:pimeloyl-ACP methyl ester carboxylesterase